MYVHPPLVSSLANGLETAASAKIHILTAAKQQILMQKEGLNREKSPSCRSFGFCFPVLKESSVFDCREKSSRISGCDPAQGFKLSVPYYTLCRPVRRECSGRQRMAELRGLDGMLRIRNKDLPV